MSQITLGGMPTHTNGELPPVGAKAPDFRLVNGSLETVGLADFKGKKKVISIVPSLDTPVCASSTRAFNEKVADRDDAVVLVASADLPFAQGRFCTSAGLDNVVPLSMMRSRNFAKDYGVLIVDGPFEGVAGRAVVVVDERDVVVHAQLVREIDDEPDYDAAFAAL